MQHNLKFVGFFFVFVTNQLAVYFKTAGKKHFDFSIRSKSTRENEGYTVHETQILAIPLMKIGSA